MKLATHTPERWRGEPQLRFLATVSPTRLQSFKCEPGVQLALSRFVLVGCSSPNFFTSLVLRSGCFLRTASAGSYDPPAGRPSLKWYSCGNNNAAVSWSPLSLATLSAIKNLRGLRPLFQTAGPRPTLHLVRPPTWYATAAAERQIATKQAIASQSLYIQQVSGASSRYHYTLCDTLSR